jgi:hypothetical protein
MSTEQPTEVPGETNEEVGRMRFAGIDIGSEQHAVAISMKPGQCFNGRYLLERKPPGTGGFALCWESLPTASSQSRRRDTTGRIWWRGSLAKASP